MTRGDWDPDALQAGPVRVVVEPGSTPGGDIMRMFETMQAYAAADAFKNQWTSSPERMVARRRAPQYLDSYRLLAYPLHWHQALRHRAHALHMQYGCSVYLPEDAAVLAEYVDFLKVSSFEAQDGATLQAARDTGVPVLCSTGLTDAETSVWDLADGEEPRTVFLHCVSAYPAPLDSLNLYLNHYGEGTNPLVGLSDHSRDVRVGGWAVCCGARVLEVHVRLDDTPAGNRDYGVAFTPAQFGQYLDNVRDAERAMGPRVGSRNDTSMRAEAAMRRFLVRKEQ